MLSHGVGTDVVLETKTTTERVWVYPSTWVHRYVWFDDREVVL